MKTIIYKLVFTNYTVNKYIIIDEQILLGTLMFKKIYKDKIFKIFNEKGNVNRYTLTNNKKRLTYYFTFDKKFIYEVDIISFNSINCIDVDKTAV